MRIYILQGLTTYEICSTYTFTGGGSNGRARTFGIRSLMSIKEYEYKRVGHCPFICLIRYKGRKKVLLRFPSEVGT